MIQNRKKANLAILKELSNENLDVFRLADIVTEKYYNKDFNPGRFIETLKKEGLIEDSNGEYRIVEGREFSKFFDKNRSEIKKILSMDFGRGDLVGQLSEQERYILHKVFSFGNSVILQDLYDSIFADIDHSLGPFSGYSRSSYAKKKARQTITLASDRGFLEVDDSVSIPDRIISDLVTEDLSEILSEFKSASEKNKHLVEENRELSVMVEQMGTNFKELDPRTALEMLTIPELIRNYIDKAITRIDERSYSEAIMNCYRVSETLVKILFDFLYPTPKGKRIKHEDKLKKIWNDEKNDKNKFPGIRVIASLLFVILWYRNKMAAHVEMTPTKEGARISVYCLIQALREFKRLDITIS